MLKYQIFDKIISAELRVHMLCIWWHHPSTGGGVVSAI